MYHESKFKKSSCSNVHSVGALSVKKLSPVLIKMPMVSTCVVHLRIPVFHWPKAITVFLHYWYPSGLHLRLVPHCIKSLSNILLQHEIYHFKEVMIQFHGSFKAYPESIGMCVVLKGTQPLRLTTMIASTLCPLIIIMYERALS